ncbi:hypothetical protein KCU65_g386, partial [Aureobasidium melanogenum]
MIASKRKTKANNGKICAWVVLTKLEMVAKTMVSLIEIWEAAGDSILIPNGLWPVEQPLPRAIHYARYN